MKCWGSIPVVAFVALFALPTLAQANPLLLGQTVRVSYEYPSLGIYYALPVDVVVGPGVELPNFAAFADVDLSDNQIVITTDRDAGINNVAFDGFHFFDALGTIPAFTSLSLNPATTYAGFDASRLTFDGDDIYVNVADLPGLIHQRIVIDVNPVPEPSTLILLGAGLVAAARKLRSGSR